MRFESGTGAASVFGYSGAAAATRLTSRSDVKAKSALQSDALKLKKRHVELLTRLPTKRLATACWGLILTKTTPLQAAPVLDFFALQVTNRAFHPQIIHNCLWMCWGQVSGRKHPPRAELAPTRDTDFDT